MFLSIPLALNVYDTWSPMIQLFFSFWIIIKKKNKNMT